LVNTAFKIMAFMMVFNFAVGIMLESVPAFDTGGNSRGLEYDTSDSDVFVNEMESGVNPSGVVEDKGNAVYRVLDMLNIGFIGRFLQTIKNYLFGFIVVMDNLLGAELPGGLHTLLFAYPLGILYTLTTIGYIYGGFSLWTGKDITS